MKFYTWIWSLKGITKGRWAFGKGCRLFTTSSMIVECQDSRNKSALLSVSNATFQNFYVVGMNIMPVLSAWFWIGYVKNEQGAGYENIFSSVQTFDVDWIENRTCHLKKDTYISKITSFDGYWFKPKGMVHLVWIGEQAYSNPYYSLILKVYHAFVFKPITIKFGTFTNFRMFFQTTCPIFNSLDTEYRYQEKICSYPVPCSFLTWPIAELSFPLLSGLC